MGPTADAAHRHTTSLRGHHATDTELGVATVLDDAGGVDSPTPPVTGCFSDGLSNSRRMRGSRTPGRRAEAENPAVKAAPKITSGRCM